MNANRPGAIITGASTGIGEAFARELHLRGYNVFLIARRGEKLAALCDELNAAVPESASFCTLDLGEISGLAAAEAIVRAGDFDLVVNNVGRGSFGYFEKLSCDEEEQMVRLNIIAPLRITHAAIPRMKEKKSGGIIFLSSIASFQPLPFMSTYAATKSFNLFQSLALRAELKPFGIKVMAVCPGPTATEFGGVARVPGTVAGIARDTAQMVAKTSVNAFERGDPYIITGFRSKLMAFGSRIAPYALSTWLLERELKKALS